MGIPAFQSRWCSLTFNQRVPGSYPGGLTNKIEGFKQRRSPGQTGWGPHGDQGASAPRIGLAGEAEDLEAAKVEFRKGFDALLYWCAMRRDGEVRWHIPAEKTAG